MHTLAFYKGSGRFDDRVICTVTRSPYSHVELLPFPPPSPLPDAPMLAISSSGLDGGVRKKWITFHPERWDFVTVPWAPADAFHRIEQQAGSRYDFLGLLGSQLLNLRRQQSGRWFCSEICAWALGLEMPHQYAPGDLKRAVEKLNWAYGAGTTPAGEPPEEAAGVAVNIGTNPMPD